MDLNITVFVQQWWFQTELVEPTITSTITEYNIIICRHVFGPTFCTEYLPNVMQNTNYSSIETKRGLWLLISSQINGRDEELY